MQMTVSRVAAAAMIAAGLLGRASAQQDSPKLDEGAAAAHAVLDRVIKATGGSERLGKVQAVSARVQGSFVGTARNISVHFNATAKGAEQYHLEMDSFQKNPLGAILIGNGEKSWIKGTDPKEKFNVKLLPLKDLLFDAGMANDIYAIQVAQFPLALRSKEFRLAIVGEDKVGDRPAQVFRVSRAGRPDVNVFVDKESALPVKCEIRVRATKTPEEFTHEIALRDYKDADGVKHFTKIAVSREGTRLFEAELSDVQFLEKVDAKKFAEP
jgi:hypothetical protein